MSEQSPGISFQQGSERTQDVVGRLREEIIADAFEAGQIRSGALAERLIRERGDAADAIASLREQVERQERELDVINSSHRDIGRRYEAAQEQVERLRDAHFNADDARCYWQHAYPVDTYSG